MSAIVYDKYAGLGQGISQAGSAFANALNQSTQQRYAKEQLGEARTYEEQKLKKLTADQKKVMQDSAILYNTLAMKMSKNPSAMEMAQVAQAFLEQGGSTDYLKAMQPYNELLLKNAISRDEINNIMGGKFGQDQPQPQPQGQPSFHGANASFQAPPSQFQMPQFGQNQQQTDLQQGNNALVGMPGFGQPQPQQNNPMAPPQMMQPQAQPQAPQQAPQQPMQPQGQMMQPQASNMRPLRNISQDQLNLIAATGSPQVKALADKELKQRITDNKTSQFTETQKLRQDVFEFRKDDAERKRNEIPFQKAEEKVNTLRQSIRQKEGALRQAKSAILTGETGVLSWGNISNVLGIPGLINQSSSQLNQAGKEFFFGNMQKVAAKAQNIWLEQRISQLAAQIGDPEAAALTKQVMLEGDMALDQAYVKAYDEIAAQDMEKFGYVKGDIEKRAFDASENESIKIADRIAFQTRELYESEKTSKYLIDHILDKVPKGTPLTPRSMKAFVVKYKGDQSKVIENARKLGYTIPSRSEVESWQ